MYQASQCHLKLGTGNNHGQTEVNNMWTEWTEQYVALYRFA